MASKARAAFDSNCGDIDRLLGIHKDLTGSGPGRRRGVEVLNKAAVVLVTSFWEAYCEDIAAEGLTHLVAHAPHAGSLPIDLQKVLAKGLKADPNELAVWRLADDGWRTELQQQLLTLQAERNRRLNTPKTAQIDDLFLKAVGIPKVSAKWYWKNMTRQQASDKLDKYVELRGEVAHRGTAARAVTKTQVNDYYKHVKLLVAKTGGTVNSTVSRATGSTLW